VDDSSEPSGAGRWLVALLILGLSGWTAFTLYERVRAPSAETPPAQPEPDSRVESFLAAARTHLVKGELEAAAEQLHKASGLSEKDPRVLEGLAQVEVARAEGTWWDLVFGKHDHDQRKRLLKKLDADVERARSAVAASIGKARSEELQTRLELSQRRLDAMLVTALGLHGDVDRARGALKARLADHPQRKLIQDFVETVGRPRPHDDEESDAGAEIKEPIAIAPEQPPGGGVREHYEFEHEPKHVPKVPGELEIPVKVPQETPSPAPGEQDDLP
jgi:hypothetical protein